MSIGGSPEVKQTQESKERASIGLQQWQRYQDKFLPVEREFFADVRDTAPERRQALGLAANETTGAFSRARPKAEAAMTNAGARPGGGRFGLGVAEMGVDEAAGRGKATVAANNAVDNQYYAGLSDLAALGRGQQASAIRGLSDEADRSAQRAITEAQASAANRNALTGAIGTAAGLAAAGFGGAGGGAAPAGAGGDFAVNVPDLDFGIPQGLSFGG